MNSEIPLPDAIRKGVDPSAPRNFRIMLAKGGLPIGASDRLGVLTILVNDPDDGVKVAAIGAWRELDGAFLMKALMDSQLHHKVLDSLTVFHADSHDLVKLVLAHPNLGGDTISRFATADDPDLLDALASNQRALTKSPEAAKPLVDNEALEPAIKARIASLLGVEIVDEAVVAAQEEEAATQAAAKEATTSDATRSQDAAFDPEGLFEEFEEFKDIYDIELPEDLPDELTKDNIEEGMVEGDSGNVYQLVQTLTIAEKIKLATLGSKAARKLLSKDTNRLVVIAVIRSPKIRDDEVAVMAQDKMISEEVLSFIFTRKDWMKNYPIKLSLCQNPKTPLPKALRLLDTLQLRDLKTLSKSKNVSQVIATTALRHVMRRSRN